MKAKTQFRLGQQITMTPQLQQAIRLLQLSSLDLKTEIQNTIESNIMLEMVEDDIAEIDTEEEIELSSEEVDLESDELILDDSTVLRDELVLDSTWEDTYGTLSPSDYANNEVNNREIGSQNNEKTLRNHLLEQLELNHFSDFDYAVAVAIIDAINEDGYLCSSFKEIEQSLGNDVNVSPDEMEVVLKRVQHFDPVGVGARGLAECLLLQLAEYDAETVWLKEARCLVQNHLSLLVVRDYNQLLEEMKLDRESLQQAIDFIKTLNPRPGSAIESHHAAYIIPDVFVRKVNERWKVDLNHETIPKIRINNYYASLIPRANNHSEVNSLKKHLQEARWFVKSLQSRHDTLLKVAQCIVERQSAFLEYGDEAMRPLILNDIATAVDVHESTISRVTTQKYIHTPSGIFELKYFFSSRVSTHNGGECSSVAIRAYIKKLISVENTIKPLSDEKIAKLLFEQGINVARRTVAKYREAMTIPSSSERKCLI